MQQHNYILLAGTIALLILTALCVYSPVHAGNVQNSFTVQANSGGNTAKNGEIITGETRSSVDIKTTVNGEVVEEVHETSPNGYLRVESTVVTNNAESFATTTVETSPRANAIQSTSIISTSPDDPVEVATPSSPIIKITETTDKKSELETETTHTSLFARFFSRISTTFTYVLSNLFS